MDMLSELVATTLRHRQRQITDNVSNNVVYLDFLRRNQGERMVSGGRSVERSSRSMPTKPSIGISAPRC